jgi:alginate O-acetyltransferase complex protein AlgI
MLFNSYPFLFVFLPIALLGYQIAGRFHRKAVVVWLAFASLVFYAYWRPALLYILLSSVAINYVAAGLISRQIPNRISSRAWLVIAITLDLAVLGYFKYLFPALNFLSSATGQGHHWDDVVLPLGISFFTFTQIAFLVDLHQGIARRQDLSSYALFVTFFPHLIAGPILHHKEMMPQFQQDRRYRLDAADLATGFTWFVMGLAKKVLLADHFAPLANAVFDSHDKMTAMAAWIGVLAYCLQLYFDFSGYSDMALGLARMFSINFPLNFNSPFKSASIIEFWQRWHMTLSNYIMAYLYTPSQLWARSWRQARGLTVSRKDMGRPGPFISLIGLPMMFTLFIAGVWHGAGFQFIVYGLLHGFYLTTNHGWRLWRHKRGAQPSTAPLARGMTRGCSVLLTFLCVAVSFIFFRSSNVAQAMSILASMSGFRHPSLAHPAAGASIAMLQLLLGYAVVWALPNSQQILGKFKPSLQESAWAAPDSRNHIFWSPNAAWAAVVGGLLFFVLSQMQDPSTFLYFQF